MKLADFGWSVRQVNSQRMTVCGTNVNLPPEMIHSKPHSKEVDIWSLGLLCYELLIGETPFAKSSTNAIANARFEIPSSVSPQASELIRKLIVVNPEERMSLSEVIEHPWIVSFT